MSVSSAHKVIPPESPPPPSGWRRLLPVALEQSGEVRTIRIFWGKLALGLAALAAAGYLALVGVLYCHAKFIRDIHQTQFTDLLLPSRWAHHQVVQGDHYIALAERQIREERALDALHNLRVGVAKSPANSRGRLLLAQIFSAAGRPDLAKDTLLNGLPHLDSDPTYLQSVFGFLLQQQLDSLTLQIARDLLAQAPPKSERHAIIALAAASACYFRGNYDQAEDFLAASTAGQSYDGRLLLAQIDWERGYRELALFNLTALTGQFPRHESAAIQLGAWLRELGRNDEFRRLSLLRQIANPEGYAPRVDLLYALHQDRDATRLARETQAVFTDFSRNHTALVALADFAANTGDSALAARVYAHCRAQNLPWEAPAFLAVESLVVKKDYRAALDLTRDLLRDHPEWAKRCYALFNSLQAVAYYGLGDPASAQLYLANFLGQADLRADNLLAVARRFTEVGARAQARQVLAQAAAADPLNQAALTGLVRLDLEMDNLAPLPDSLRRLVAMRKPSVELLRTAQRKLGSDLLLFSPARDESLRQLQLALANAASGASRLPR